MEDWQVWQIQADQVAQGLNADVDTLESTYLAVPDEQFDFRGFWPRFRDLKERVRIAPAIRLEAKLDLERRLRGIGSRAYKAQDAAFARSEERKTQLLEEIASLRTTAERETAARTLRTMRREFDRMRESFDAGPALVPAHRQAVWEAWREANQFAWNRLSDIWRENEARLREILTAARQNIERGNAQAARQGIARFFDSLKSYEAKQDAVNAMKAEVDEIRREADAVEERALTQRSGQQSAPAVPALENWRTDLARNRELAERLSEEVAELDRQVAASGSILEQAMLRGNLVDKRRRLTELERTSRQLEQRIEQTEAPPLIPTA